MQKVNAKENSVKLVKHKPKRDCERLGKGRRRRSSKRFINQLAKVCCQKNECEKTTWNANQSLAFIDSSSLVKRPLEEL